MECSRSARSTGGPFPSSVGPETCDRPNPNPRVETVDDGAHVLKWVISESKGKTFEIFGRTSQQYFLYGSPPSRRHGSGGVKADVPAPVDKPKGRRVGRERKTGTEREYTKDPPSHPREGAGSPVSSRPGTESGSVSS